MPDNLRSDIARYHINGLADAIVAVEKLVRIIHEAGEAALHAFVAFPYILSHGIRIEHVLEDIFLLVEFQLPIVVLVPIALHF